MPITVTTTGSYIGSNNIQNTDNSTSVGTNFELKDMFNSQCGNNGSPSPGMRNNGGGANYNPQNGDPNYFENFRQRAANGMPSGFPFNVNGMSSGSPPNGSRIPQPGQASPQASYPNQGSHAPQPQYTSTMPSAQSVPQSQPGVTSPPLAQHSVPDALVGQQNTPSRFSLRNLFKRSRK